MSYQTRIDRFEIKSNEVYYKIKVNDLNSFKSWDISVTLDNLEEMHDRLSEENPKFTLPDFPTGNLLSKFMSSIFFKAISEEDALRKQLEVERYLILLLGVQRPPRISSLSHFLQRGSLENFRPTPNIVFELNLIRSRDDLYKLYQKTRLLNRSQFVKVYQFTRKLNTKAPFQNIILKRMTFDSPLLRQPLSEQFIYNEIQVAKRAYEITNSLPGFIKVYGIFSDFSKPKKTVKATQRPRCWVLMEVIEETLAQRFEKQRKLAIPFTQGFMFNLLRQCAIILNSLADQKFYHRNIKSSNIVIRDDKVFIMDANESNYKVKDQFVIAKDQPEIIYRPPEKRITSNNSIVLAHKHDVWSLGMMILSLCTLQNDSEILKNLDSQVINENSKEDSVVADKYISALLNAVFENYGKGFSNLIARMVCKQQDNRCDLKTIIDELNDGRYLDLTGTILPHNLNDKFKIDRIILLKNLEEKNLQSNLRSIEETKRSDFKLIINLMKMNKDIQLSLKYFKQIIEKSTVVHLILQNSSVNDQLFIELINCIESTLDNKKKTLLFDLKNTSITNISIVKLVEFSKKNVKLSIDLMNCPQFDPECILGMFDKQTKIITDIDQELRSQCSVKIKNDIQQEQTSAEIIQSEQ